MRSPAILILALFLATGAAVSAAEEFSEVEYYKQLAEQQLAEMNGDAFRDPANAFLIIPQYFHSRTDSGTADTPDGAFRFGKSRASGAGVTALYNRVLADNFSFGVFYQYGFLNVRGGYAVPDDPADRNRYEERTRWHSHVLGAQAEIGLGPLGRLVPSITQAFDFASGEQYAYAPSGAPAGAPFSMDGEGASSVSLIAWYEKDINFCDAWTFTPYAGWRSTFTRLKSALPDVDGAHSRTHLVSGGLKVAYQGERAGFNFRAGFSHKTNPGEAPGYGDRAVANGVAFFSHQANLDRTVGSVGAGVSYALSDSASFAVNYDGMFGSKTSAHMGTVTFALSF